MAESDNKTPKRISMTEGNPLAEVLRACKSAFFTAAVFSFFVNILILTMPLYMFSLFMRVLGSGSLTTLFMLAIMAFSALLIQAFIDIARTYLFVQVSAWIDAQIGEKLLDISIKDSLPRGNGASTGLLQKLNSLRTFLAGQQVYMLMDAPWVPIFIGVLFMMNTAIGTAAFIIASIMLFLAFLNKWVSDPALDEANSASMASYSVAGAAVNNADVVEAMGMRQPLMARWSRYNATALRLQGVASRYSGIIQAFVKMMRMLSIMSVMTVAAIQILDPESGLSRGAMMASILLVSRALMPIDSLVSSWPMVTAALDNYKEISAALEKDHATIRELVTPPAPIGDLLVQNLAYQPPGSRRAILNRISFHLKPGEALGIVGPSASGKSTLARFLVGLENPNFGVVRFDGTDIKLWPTESRGQYIGYLPQDVSLLNGNIRENISRFAPDPSAEAVIEAAEMAGVHSMIQHFPHGYGTPIGAGGSLLSGGERQRIGLARAVYGNPKIVVLDEPNANLDVAGEEALAETIEELKRRGTTVVVILHRPNILKSVDYIMVMRDGAIQKLAPRDEMLPILQGRQKTAEIAKSSVPMLAQQKSS